MFKDKKKVLIMALLLFTFMGVVGYGVYSYYYTEGSIETNRASDENSDNVIRITGSFNPTTDASSSSSGSGSGSGAFLGNGGSLSLDCPEISGGYETITCTASVTVRNEGSTTISVDYYDESSSASITSGDSTVSAEEPSMHWGGSDSSRYTTISSGSSETLYISVDVNVGDSDYIAGDTAQLVTEPVTSGSLEAYVSFRLSASQYTY